MSCDDESITDTPGGGTTGKIKMIAELFSVGRKAGLDTASLEEIKNRP
jgi:hypothetical protein